jgi:hypothetical protein
MTSDPMNKRLPFLERAFELARSGTMDSVPSIEAVLHREGYAERRLEGTSLRKQLREIIVVAKRGAQPGQQ